MHVHVRPDASPQRVRCERNQVKCDLRLRRRRRAGATRDDEHDQACLGRDEFDDRGGAVGKETGGGVERERRRVAAGGSQGRVPRQQARAPVVVFAPDTGELRVERRQASRVRPRATGLARPAHVRGREPRAALPVRLTVGGRQDARRIDPAPLRVEQHAGLGAFGGREDLHGAALVGEQVHERDVRGHAALERTLLFEVAAADLDRANPRRS